VKAASDLYAAAKAYVQAAIALLSADCPEGPPETPGGLREWVRSSGETFTLRDAGTPYWHKGVLSHEGQLHSFSEYRAFVDALHADPPLARHLGALVGTTHGRLRISEEQVADHLIWTMAEKCGRFTFDSAEFDRLFAEFEADLRRDDLDFIAAGPMPNFKCESLPLRLAPDLEIDYLTDEEIVRCLRLGIYPGIDLGGHLHLTAKCGIRCRFVQKKLFGELRLTPDEMRKLQSLPEGLTDRFQDVLFALRLFKEGRISMPGLVIFSRQWPMNGGTASTRIDPGLRLANNYELNTQEVLRFQRFWSDFERVRAVPFLDNAIRRFGYSGERHRPEDRLVDLLISAESLFLSDTGETRERGELRFRLALRFAFFTELDGYNRRERFRLMRSAYDARSSVVHGGRLDEDDLKIPGEGKVPLSRFVDVVEEAIRYALHKAIEIKPMGKTTPVDWDALIFG